MSVTSFLIPSFTQMLRALSAWLDKAVAHQQAAGLDPDALLTKRLADDMFPLSAQIRFACFQGQEAVYRLRGEALPDALVAVRVEGSNAGERAGTMAEAQARIAEALAFFATLGPDALDDGEGGMIAHDLPMGMIFDMTGEQFARDWALPQFYFHLNIAYAILRNHGVQLGKADYVAHAFAYLRPGTMPRG